MKIKERRNIKLKNSTKKVQIGGIYEEYYYLTEDGLLYDEKRDKYIEPYKKHVFSIKTKEGKFKNIALKTLYRQLYDKEFCVDNIPNLENEEWRYIKGTEKRYMISNKGRVKSLTGYEAKILKYNINQRGYYRVELQYLDSDLRKVMLVHRLVADAFLESPESIEYQLHHIDLDLSNNTVENLIWLSPSEHRKWHQQLKKAIKL